MNKAGIRYPAFKLVEVPRIEERPAIPEDGSVLVDLTCYYLTLLTRLGPGKLEAELVPDERKDKVDWFFCDYRSVETPHPIRCRPVTPKLADSLPSGFFRSILAKLGAGCIGDDGLYGGSGLFQIKFAGEEQPFNGRFRIFMSNTVESGFWVKLYWHGFDSE